MDYGTYTGGIYPDNNNWARWVMDNMQGNIPDYGMPSPPPPAREDPYNARTNLDAALMTVKQAAEEEPEDKAFYDYLISIAPSQEDKDILVGIKNDGLKHYRLLRQIYFDLTGERLADKNKSAFQPPPSYGEGLRNALLSKQSAVVTYRKVLFAMRNRRHINMMTEIITDQLRHVGLYSYLFSKNGRSM